MATQEEFEKMSDSEKKKEDWMNSKWRPMMGWMYMAVCMCDFIFFPVLWSVLQAVMKVGQITQWNPLTLQGAGLFHIAMGAVLGLAAWGRTQEKLGGAEKGGLGTAPAPSGFSVPASPAPSFSAPAPASSGFGGGFGATPAAAPAVGFSSSGKAMPPPQVDPVL